mmetsp:Transcript_5397/g.8399  ORF Transcript_5397/g.8399 Transcript_5397/m.8399 type:complete len:97 (-) Transcript_5397:509-799(-)
MNPSFLIASSAFAALVFSSSAAASGNYARKVAPWEDKVPKVDRTGRGMYMPKKISAGFGTKQNSLDDWLALVPSKNPQNNSAVNRLKSLPSSLSNL